MNRLGTCVSLPLPRPPRPMRFMRLTVMIVRTGRRTNEALIRGLEINYR